MIRARQKRFAAGAAALVALVALIALVGAGLAARRSGPAPDLADPAPRPAQAPQLSPPPGVALLVTRPGGTTALVVSRPGEASLPDPIAAFDHGAGGRDPGAVLAGPGDRRARRGRRRASSASPCGQAPQRIAGGVVRGSRPLITPSGRVLVAREGDEDAKESRVDALDPVTGVSHTLHAARGERLGLAGVAGREVLIHRVGRTGADLVAVDEGPPGSNT